MLRSQHDLAIKLGVKPEDFVKEYLKQVAKKRRWQWFFELEKKNGRAKNS
jgi:hypothetical protein